MINRTSSKLWLDVCLVISLVVLALALRLYKIDTPLADWHSWRQADTASVTREYVKHNYPWWYPHYHDLSNIPNGIDNLEGVRMVEAPINNYWLAQFIRQKPETNLVVASRLVSVSWSLMTVAAMYWLVMVLSKQRGIAFLSSLLIAIWPYSIFYSRAILPEPSQVATQVLALASFAQWLSDRAQERQRAWLWYFLAWISLALTLLFKPTSVFIWPVFLVLGLSRWANKAWMSPAFWLLVLTPAGPVMAWRWWIAHYPAGIPASTWLLNGNGIRLRPSWWRWLFGDRISGFITGGWGTGWLLLGLAAHQKQTKEWGGISILDWVSWSWCSGILAYLVIFATGNVQHDYYQAMLVPPLALLAARGVVWLWSLPKQPIAQATTAAGLGLTLVLSLFLSWYQIKGFYNINNPAIVTAGQAVDRLTPASAKLIAPYGGDTAFLFQTNRTGWPVGGSIPQRISNGATHYVTTALDDEAKALELHYTTLEKTNEYLLLDLTRPL
jgi:hypothetical protein